MTIAEGVIVILIALLAFLVGLFRRYNMTIAEGVIVILIALLAFLVGFFIRG